MTTPTTPNLGEPLDVKIYGEWFPVESLTLKYRTTSGHGQIELRPGDALPALRNVTPATQADEEDHRPTPHEPVKGVTLWNIDADRAASESAGGMIRVDGVVTQYIYEDGEIRDVTKSIPYDYPRTANNLTKFADALRAHRDRIRAARSAAQAASKRASGSATPDEIAAVKGKATTPNPHEPVEGVKLYRHTGDDDDYIMAVHVDDKFAGTYNQHPSEFVARINNHNSFAGAFKVPNGEAIRDGGTRILCEMRDKVRGDREAAAAKSEATITAKPDPEQVEDVKRELRREAFPNVADAASCVDGRAFVINEGSHFEELRMVAKGALVTAASQPPAARVDSGEGEKGNGTGTE